MAYKLGPSPWFILLFDSVFLKLSDCNVRANHELEESVALIIVVSWNNQNNCFRLVSTWQFNGIVFIATPVLKHSLPQSKRFKLARKIGKFCYRNQKTKFRNYTCQHVTRLHLKVLSFEHCVPCITAVLPRNAMPLTARKCFQNWNQRFDQANKRPIKANIYGLKKVSRILRQGTL